MREQGPAEYGEGTTLTDTAHAIGEAHGVRTCRVLGDLTDAAQVERVIATVEAELGPIEILVHNAGGDIAAEGGKPDPNDAVWIKEADVRAVLERNLLSTILVCQRVARDMMERRRGRILTLSSIAAFQGRAHGVIYATAKAGVVQYTRCLAAQLRPYDVTVNTLAPGDTRTGRFLGTRAGRRSASSRPARSSGSPRSTRWRAWSSSSPGRSARSSPARCCGSMAAPSAGRAERSTAGHDRQRAHAVPPTWLTASVRVRCRRVDARSAAADERHLGRHDGHELHVGSSGRLAMYTTRSATWLHVHQRLRP